MSLDDLVEKVGNIRREFVEGGAAVLIVMLVGYVAIGGTSLPTNLSNLFLIVAGLGAIILVLGLFLKEPTVAVNLSSQPAQVVSPGQWACGRCGAINPGTSSFCGKCGQARTAAP